MNFSIENYPRLESCSKRDTLIQYKTGVAFYIDRKSRIVVKDIERLFLKIKENSAVISGKKIFIITTAPVCSKSIKLLTESSISLINV